MSAEVLSQRRSGQPRKLSAWPAATWHACLTNRPQATSIGPSDLAEPCGQGSRLRCWPGEMATKSVQYSPKCQAPNNLCLCTVLQSPSCAAADHCVA